MRWPWVSRKQLEDARAQHVVTLRELTSSKERIAALEHEVRCTREDAALDLATEFNRVAREALAKLKSGGNRLAVRERLRLEGFADALHRAEAATRARLRVWRGGESEPGAPPPPIDDEARAS